MLDAPFLQHLGHAHGFEVVPGVPGFADVGLLGDELRVVLVRRDHEGGETRFVGLLRQGPDHVVSLPARDADHRDVEPFDQPEQVGQRGAQVFRHGVPLRLVLGILLVAVSRFGRIEHRGDVGGPVLVQDAEDGVGDGEHHGYVHPRRSHPRVTDQPEMTPIGQRHPVQQEQGLLRLSHKWFAPASRDPGGDGRGTDRDETGPVEPCIYTPCISVNPRNLPDVVCYFNYSATNQFYQ